MYSHTSLSMYQQCPLRYRFRYIDRVEVKDFETVEAFLGKRVHEALEKLYTDLMHEKTPSMEELVSFYEGLWTERWNDDVVINNHDYEGSNYRDMGQRFIEDYYRRHYPFHDSRTLGLEVRVVIEIDEDGGAKLQGYIDRLAKVEEGHLQIHDYKTSSHLPRQEEMDEDRQLALYAIGVRDLFPETKQIDLVWHYLAFDHVLVSHRSWAQLDDLRQDTLALIHEIESCPEFPSKPSNLCSWCQFQDFCPEFIHLRELQEDPRPDSLEAQKLVDRYADLKQKEKDLLNDIKNEAKELEERILSFAIANEVSAVYGSNSKVKVDRRDNMSLPRKNSPEQEALVSLLKEVGLWEDMVTLDNHALQTRLQKDPGLCARLQDKLPGFINKESKHYLRLSSLKENERQASRHDSDNLER
ncbi:MAG: RecB family exonuclease [Candidatus Methanomethylophilaceae archaeon]